MGFKIALKNISTLCFLLLWSVQETTCFIKKHKLIEFQEKLQEMVASSSPIPPPSPAVSQTKQSGRVFYPIGYGADPTGVQDSRDAILNALNDAFQVQNGLQLLSGVNDLGGVVIDLQGGNYKISMPLRFPASGGGNVVVKGGTLRASDMFPGDRHLIEVWSQNSQVLDKRNKVHDPNGFPAGKLQNGAILYEDITFRDILFDSGYRGGGIFVVNSARIRINNCFFLHFTTEGILVQGGHETFISSCFLGQHSTVGGDPGERNFSGTAIELGSNDNAITDVALFSAAIGVLLRGQANILTGIHCYNKATGFGGVGIMVKLYASLTRIDNCYLDYNSIVMEDPVQVHVTNGLFLGEGNIVLKAINGKISGVNIVNNMFNADPKGTTPIVGLDGTFTSVDQVLIDQNDVVSGMKYKSTVGKLTVAGNATKWVADFSSVLLFPNQINHFQYSFYIHGMPNGFPNHAITNVSNNVVVVESDKLVNAVVSVIVDQCNMAAENNERFLGILLVNPFARTTIELLHPARKATRISRKAAKERVFYPMKYGADPTGERDSSDAILKALNYAFQVQNEFELLPGINDLAGVVIDLQGGNYKISKPIRFPAGGGNVLVHAGTLRASDDFPSDRYLVELWSPSSTVVPKPSNIHPDGGEKKNVGIYYEDVTFRDILTRIHNCFFIHFTTEGILVQKGHETFISSCFLGQHVTIGGDPKEKNYTGTAIDLASNDNAITDVAIFSAAIGVLLRGQANILTGVHCYNKATGFGGVGILVKPQGSLTRMDNCYLDWTAIVMEDPVQIHVTNGFFLGDANVVLKAAKGIMSGVTIVDNMFKSDANSMRPIVQLDGNFASIDQVVIDNNNAVGMAVKSTAGKLTVPGNGTKWVADFSSILVFPDRINHFQYSFNFEGVPVAFPAHGVTSLSNNVVVVESDRSATCSITRQIMTIKLQKKLQEMEGYRPVNATLSFPKAPNTKKGEYFIQLGMEQIQPAHRRVVTP
ncbi:hypothetical protein NC653_008572 [Populus alba x Populus x berolinensis]|uniref:Uncharacterized protein n=1 Tax=Populus alba x Populus x berolinensis TaxID=444605 RepID=A0AAD6WAC7_9ROSI|nr:hypothetical protein NC653_008572 [Populus alba x Populus x berolinensis]